MKRPLPIAAGASLALAAASLLIPSAPTTDPWGWIVWGREIAHLDLTTAIGGAPSWKPLPVLFTAPLSVFGGAAPSLWLMVARAGGLLGLVAAFRLGSRLGGRYSGALAATGLVLSANWTRAFLHGYSEPLAIALLLFAVDRHWSGRPRQALLLLAAVSLARPEAFPIALGYGILIWRRHGTGAWTGVAAAVLVPALWLVPDLIGSGDPFHAGQVSAAVEPHGLHATLVALADGISITPIPLSLAALAGFAIAWRRGDRRVVELSGLAVAWAGLLVGLMVAGYPATGRFFVLPAALVCVLGADGAVQAARLTAASGRRAQVVTLAALLAALPLVAVRARATEAEADDAVQRTRVEASLDRAIEDAGPGRLHLCGTPVLPKGLGWLRGDVAWRLGLPLERVRSVRTTADEYLADLSRFGTGEAPRTVSVRPRSRRVVLLAPFGGTRLGVARPRLDLDLAGRAGTWRVLVPDPGACRASLREPFDERHEPREAAARRAVGHLVVAGAQVERPGGLVVERGVEGDRR